MLWGMRHVHISPGKALCRFCGERVATNSLSTHIARALILVLAWSDMSPTLVRKRAVGEKRPPEEEKDLGKGCGSKVVFES